MELNEYQSQAARSDQRPPGTPDDLLIPLLGLAGEVGSLLSEYKKRARDGEGHQRFNEQAKEEFGDILWYLANLAAKSGIALEDIAQTNLAKVQGRWLQDRTSPRYFDEAFPEAEQLPRTFEVTFDFDTSTGRSKVAITRDGAAVGNLLTDNSYVEDGYRFHDAYHFTFAALLGWSPVTRRNLKRKRKSKPMVDEVEDGGRGWVIEEGIAALAFAYAGEHGFFEHTQRVDAALLKVVRILTQTVEVKVRSPKEWEHAIVTGSRIFKNLLDHNGGRLSLNLEDRSIAYLPPIAGG